MKQPTNIRDIRTQVSEASQTIEKLTKEIELYKSLPVVHENLQEKIRSCARFLFYLQMNHYSKQSEHADEKERAIFERDILKLTPQT